MNIFINGQQITLSKNNNAKANTVSDALLVFLANSQQQQSFAVALNGNFVGRDAYQHTALVEQDALNVLFPIQGG
jgi:sulfur carrier protein